ncbi:hypothetical protein B5M09_008000 [Aphanomyces astaci]|uniref:Doublecortin domain-containing protein n=1 Tax=Aphanomyces astaci TaxID=112090 RepID=A0A425DHF1_APHAT|nr:hypothetical protein B5M09_008000 [Aphanomyces astaci]
MALVCLGANDTKVVTVFNNGESVGGIQVRLTPEHVPTGQHLAEYLSTLLDVEGMYTDETKTSSKAVADRVFTAIGKPIHSFDDIAPNDELYIVPTGLLFVWPFVKYGHRVTVQSAHSPTGKPIVLESYNDSPRVFLIHNFFTNEEADRLIERISEIDDDINKLKRSTVGHDDKGSAANLWVWNRNRNGPEGSPLKVDFVNTRDYPVKLFWANSHMSDLAPGHKINFNSFGKHIWTFRDVDGNDLFTHTLNYKDGLVQVISLPPLPPSDATDESNHSEVPPQNDEL